MFHFSFPKKRFLLALMVLAGMATPALATVNSVTGAPANATVSQTAPTILNVTWTVSVTFPAGPPGTEVVQSTGASISAGGTTVQTVTTPFFQVVTGPGGTTTTPTFNETITVSPSVATAIANAGSGRISRVFSGNANSATGVIGLIAATTTTTTPGTNNSGTATSVQTIAISALELSFEDGSRYATVSEGQRLRARADIAQSGRGTLLGTWEIADLSFASDDLPPRFRPIERVQRIVTGNQKITIFSPPLPTARQAPYIVRFNVEQPAGITAPQLRYTVIAGTIPERIRIIAPPEGAPVGTDTRFEWAPEPGASAYRVEFGPAPAPGERRTDGIIAAIDMQADSTSVNALPFTLETLEQNPRLEWRVVALDANGLPIAISPFRRIGLGDIGSQTPGSR